eukprot:SAG31_NODE_415_length_15951_cov_13.530848_10_plen_529_part_00
MVSAALVALSHLGLLSAAHEASPAWLSDPAAALKTDDKVPQPVPVPRTFGNGVLSSVHNPPADGGDGSPALVVLNHTLHSGSAYGVMTHYWSTGEVVNWDTVVDYYVDGEETPSISLMEDMACGQGFPKAEFGTFNGNGTPWRGEAPAGRTGLFAAGEKMGKGGQVGGYYHYHKILFQESIRVEARSLGGNQVVYIVVRGHEVAKGTPAAAGLVMPSGFMVPPNAKLQLQRIDNVTYQPLELVPLVTLPSGYAGLLYMTTFAIQTVPAGNNYIEGCWHLSRTANESWPGLVLGTGVEDFFDSAYGFCATSGQGACLFAHPTSGLLHFSRTAWNGSDVIADPAVGYTGRPRANDTAERLSAYRFFDQEVVGFSDGGALHWRVGDVAGKCSGCPSGTANCQAPFVFPVAVRSYAWVYTWPLAAGTPAAPNAPPLKGPPPPPANVNGSWVGPVNGLYDDAFCPNVGCHSGVAVKQCEALCDEHRGCNAFNFASGGCCLRVCPVGRRAGPPPHSKGCCAYYYDRSKLTIKDT